MSKPFTLVAYCDYDALARLLLNTGDAEFVRWVEVYRVHGSVNIGTTGYGTHQVAERELDKLHELLGLRRGVVLLDLDVRHDRRDVLLVLAGATDEAEQHLRRLSAWAPNPVHVAAVIDGPAQRRRLEELGLLVNGPAYLRDPKGVWPAHTPPQENAFLGKHPVAEDATVHVGASKAFDGPRQTYDMVSHEIITDDALRQLVADGFTGPDSKFAGQTYVGTPKDDTICSGDTLSVTATHTLDAEPLNDPAPIRFERIHTRKFGEGLEPREPLSVREALARNVCRYCYNSLVGLPAILNLGTECACKTCYALLRPSTPAG